MSAHAARQLAFKVHGMDCAEEVAVLKQIVGPAAGGGDHLAFDILNGQMFVSTTTGVPSEEAIVRAVRGCARLLEARIRRDVG